MLSYIALLFSLISLLSTSSSSSSNDHISTYIVHAAKSRMPAPFAHHYDWYISTLASVKGLKVSEMMEEHKSMYTYDVAMHGFSARLTPSQAHALHTVSGFTILPDSALHLHTTHTPEFLHLSTVSGLWPASNYGEDVIVGIFDTGVWPERPSFSDHDFTEIPARWKGQCEEGSSFTASLCNKKLIGARAFYKGYEAVKGPMNETKEYKSARDSEGHGTHTSSTAAGREVYNTSLLGYAPGNARGVAPKARIAAYKVCWLAGCFNSDVLAAIESAIVDGVDIISMSLGGTVHPFYVDSVAIGAFAAMEKGIVVSCSAGNSGPQPLTVANVAPWMFTIAASSVDRSFPSPVILGNGASYVGASLYSGEDLGTQQIPLVYAGDAALNGNASAHLCFSGSINPAMVANKIVLCDRGTNARVNKGLAVREAGGAGMVLANAAENGEELTADAHLLPAALVGFKAGVEITQYISATKNPTANIQFKGTELGVKPAPVMAAFSSRGPSTVSPQILKPDITAPGVNILAAWTGAIGPTAQIGDSREVEFNIMSGTSMSCPHVSGLAALLKGAHPDWSPAAIKSALMTTATNVDNSGDYVLDGATFSLATPLCYGAGHVNPEAALNPGLIYELKVQDYVDFLCGLGYSEMLLEIFTKGNYSCSEATSASPDLNYPAISAVFDQTASSNFSRTLRRRVTNVGDSNSVYNVSISAPSGVKVRVNPETLSFKEKNETQVYEVIMEAGSVEVSAGKNFEQAFGYIAWKDGVHVATSPMVFIWLPRPFSFLTNVHA